MIPQVRYALSVLAVVVLPSGLLFWLIIHTWARWWKTLGPARTYFTVLPFIIALGALLFHFRIAMIGADLGTNRWLIAIALVLYGVVLWLEPQYWKQLSIPILVGVPELSPTVPGQGRLLRDGIYGVVRHPRYLSAGIGVVANALIGNYLGVYILIVLLFTAGYPLIVLEERELVERLGEPYRTYQREVPRLVPRLVPSWRRRP